MHSSNVKSSVNLMSLSLGNTIRYLAISVYQYMWKTSITRFSITRQYIRACNIDLISMK